MKLLVFYSFQIYEGEQITGTGHGSAVTEFTRSEDWNKVTDRIEADVVQRLRSSRRPNATGITITYLHTTEWKGG